MKKKSPRIEIAPRDKQKITEEIEDIFFSKVLDCEGMMITDESRLSDFLSYPPERSIGPGKEPGTMQFKIYSQRFGPLQPGETMAERFKKMRDKSNYKESIIEVEPSLSKDEVISRTKKVFDVDITPVYDKYIVDILEHIVVNYNPKKSI